MPDKPRWAKTAQERIDDTLEYIKSKLELVDYNEVNSKVNTMNDSQKKRSLVRFRLVLQAPNHPSAKPIEKTAAPSVQC